MKKNLLALLLLCSISLSGHAQSIRQDIQSQPTLSAGNYLPYPDVSHVKLTPAPEGYVPFYLSHYGRHGSRYLIDPRDYTNVLRPLEQADAKGVLTAKGKQTLDVVRKMYHESLNRYGELTPLGAKQHRGIAQRMIAHYPEVFAGDAHVDAKSTVVIRCILSMENELQELLLVNPQLQITHDASEHDMYYMNYNDTALFSRRWNAEARKALDSYQQKLIDGSRLASSLISDPAYIREHVNANQLFRELFSLTAILPNSDLGNQYSLYDLFTNDELYHAFLANNAYWYIHGGACKLNGAQQPYSQRNLLRNIITTADSCIALSHPGATLRFGHDTMLLPLSVLLNINGLGVQLNTLDELASSSWACYKIFPMGSNLQWVFYRNAKKPKDILFKLLLNEQEVTLPDLKPVSGPYYRWSDFRGYFLQKIDAFQLQQ